MLDSGSYVLVNALEEVVKTEVKTVLRNVDMCKCDKCYFDVCALVLNNLKPNYATTEKGAVLAKVGSSLADIRTDMMIEIGKAIGLVSKSPRH